MTVYKLNYEKLENVLKVVSPMDEKGKMRLMAYSICENSDTIDQMKLAIDTNVKMVKRRKEHVYAQRYCIYFKYLKEHLVECFDVRIIL